MQTIYIIIPVYLMLFSCGIILFLTYILFKPAEPISILGYKIQGIIPASLPGLIQHLKSSLPTLLPSFDSLEARFTKTENFEKIMPLIENHVDDFLRNRLSVEMPVISMFIGDKTISKLKGAFMTEIESLFPVVMKQYAANLKTELDLEHIVIQKVAGFSSDKLEEVLYQIMSKEFRFVEIIGAVIGFIIGLVQVLITELTT